MARETHSSLILTAIGFAVLVLLLTGCQEKRPDSAPTARADSFKGGLQTALREGDRSVRAQRLAELFDSMEPDQVTEAVAVYEKNLNGIRDIEIELFFDSWARHDPPAALVYLNQWSNQSQREAAFRATMYRWALEDPLAARVKVDEILEQRPLLRRLALTNLVSGWAYSGQPGVEAYVLQLSTQAFLPIAATALVGTQTRRLDSNDLVAWTNELLRVADTEIAAEFFKRTLRQLAGRDPAAARAFADSHAHAHYADKRARHVIEPSLAHDPGPTLDWAEQFDLEIRHPPLQYAAQSWLKEDFDGASAFIQGTTLRAVHDPIVEEYVLTLARQGEWESSVAWAERIQDDKKRQLSLRGVVIRWLRKDPEAAQPWLEESAIEASERASMLEIAARPVEPARSKRGKPRARAPR